MEWLNYTVMPQMKHQLVSGVCHCIKLLSMTSFHIFNLRALSRTHEIYNPAWSHLVTRELARSKDQASSVFISWWNSKYYLSIFLIWLSALSLVSKYHAVKDVWEKSTHINSTINSISFHILWWNDHEQFSNQQAHSESDIFLRMASHCRWISLLSLVF